MDSRKIGWGTRSGGWQEQRYRGVREQEAFWEQGRTRAGRNRRIKIKSESGFIESHIPGKK